MTDKELRARFCMICGALGAMLGQGDLTKSIIMGLVVGGMMEGIAWVIRRMERW